MQFIIFRSKFRSSSIAAFSHSLCRVPLGSFSQNYDIVVVWCYLFSKSSCLESECYPVSNIPQFPPLAEALVSKYHFAFARGFSISPSMSMASLRCAWKYRRIS